MEEKKPLKIKFKTAVVLVIIGAIILTIFGANVYALKHGYDNIFFLIKYKITGESEKITDRDKLLIEDDDKKTVEIQKEDVKFSDEEVKKSFQKYLDLVGAKWLESYDILIKLDLIKESDRANFKQASTDGYLKTNIKYFDFKNKMLNYVTENCFENDIIVLDSVEHKAYINEDGYLCCANSGSSGGDYIVQSITKINEKQYMAKVIHTLEEGEEDINYNFGIENNNGKCVIDYCREILSDKTSIENESFKNNIVVNGINPIKFVQFDTFFYKVEDIAIDSGNSTKISNYKDFEYDLDGDGRKDRITIRGKDIISYKDSNGSDVYTGKYVYELNGVEFADAGSFGKIYIVDIDKNDKTFEVVAWDNGPSDDSVYRIFSKQNNSMKEVLNEWTDNLYIDQLGKILPSGSYSPKVFRKYYTFSENSINKLKVNELDLTNIEFDANECYFSSNNENFINFISKFNKNRENIDDFNSAFTKTLNDCNIEKLGNGLKFKIIRLINDYDNNALVELSDGRKGYIQEDIRFAD